MKRYISPCSLFSVLVFVCKQELKQEWINHDQSLSFFFLLLFQVALTAPLNKVKRNLSSLCLYYFFGCCTYVQGLLLTSEKRKGWRGWHSFLWGLYLKGELINFHQNPNMCKLVTWPHLAARGLDKISYIYILFWISICRVNIFTTMGIEGYGYLDTASVCRVFITYSFLYDHPVKDQDSSPSWSFLVKTMKLDPNVILVSGKQLFNHPDFCLLELVYWSTHYQYGTLSPNNIPSTTLLSPSSDKLR